MASAARLRDVFFYEPSPEDSSPQRTAPAATSSRPATVFELPLPLPFVGINRRFQPRVRAAFSARAEDGARYAGLDLSVGGMLCQSDDLMWPGNVLHLELILDDEPTPVAVQARVVEIVSRRGVLAMRLRFDEVAPRGRARIAMWMARSRAAI
jgi:hypothetical protein